MYQSVRDSWHAYSTPLEGRVLHMYLDILGLVTCGVGNLIDPVSEALKLPWKKLIGGEFASPDEIRSAWQALKSRQDLAHRSAGNALAVTGLVLTDADVDALVASRLASNEAFLTKELPAFESFPADAQLGILSMAWAVGAGFTAKFPTFTRAVLAQDWFAAQASCKIREEGNPGVVPRNAANRVCFGNAAIVAGAGMDRSRLWWPAPARPESSAEPKLGVGSPDAAFAAREQQAVMESFDAKSNFRDDGTEPFPLPDAEPKA